MRKKEFYSSLVGVLFIIILLAAVAFCLFAVMNCVSSPQNKVAQKESESQSEKTERIEKESKNAVNMEIPLCPAQKQEEDHQIRKFSYYSICYRESYEQAEWSAEVISKDRLEKSVSRQNDFRIDPEILTGSADLADYKKSGFDRGHLTPAADMAFNPLAMSETFYMSNMSPQFPAFNRGIWKDLEEDVRKLALRHEKIYLVTGPVLEKKASEYESIGKNKVSIPQYFYKVMLFKDSRGDWNALAYIIPNKKCEENPDFYKVSVDEVESRTNLDFFSPLEDEIEEKIESAVKK